MKLLSSPLERQQNCCGKIQPCGNSGFHSLTSKGRSQSVQSHTPIFSNPSHARSLMNLAAAWLLGCGFLCSSLSKGEETVDDSAKKENSHEAGQGITIGKALYGSREQFATGDAKDVTEKAREYVADGTLHIPHTRQAFGDPHPYKGKVFRMTYLLDGKDYVFVQNAGAIAFEPAKETSKEREEYLRKRYSEDELKLVLEKVRTQYGLPGMGVAVVWGDQISIATSGTRKVGHDYPITKADQWHLGSCGKSMNSALIARLVEEGKITWSATLPELLPDMKEAIDPGYKDVTLAHLLCHRAGLPKGVVPKEMLHGGWHEVYSTWHAKKESLPEQRTSYARLCLSRKPEYLPGTKMDYSNAGYVIAAAIVERVTGISWEEAISKYLFGPLQMKSISFGTQNTKVPLEPWPHMRYLEEGIKAKEQGSGLDLPLVATPAGLVRCNLEDWGKYATFWMKGLAGEKTILQETTLQYLTTPVQFPGVIIPEKENNYSHGWHLLKRPWSKSDVLQHTGSNLRNQSVIWIAPYDRFAVLCVTNCGDSGDALNQVVDAVVSEWSRRP